MDIKAELERAELLAQQIKRTEEERQRIFDRVTRETFWLKAGDVIVIEEKQRRGLLGLVKTHARYFVVREIRAYDWDTFRRDNATIGVWWISPQSGLVDRRGGISLMHCDHSRIKRLGCVDNMAVERVDLASFTSNKA